MQSTITSIRTELELIDLSEGVSGSRDCFCNLGHPHHTTVVADGLAPLAILTVGYHNTRHAQYVLVQSIAKTICLVLPMYLDMFKSLNMGNNWEFMPLSKRTRVSFTLDGISVRVILTELETHYEEREDRLKIDYLTLNLNFVKVLKS